MQILDSFDCIVVAYAENLILVYRNCFCFNLSGPNSKLMNLAPSSIGGLEIPDAQPRQVQILTYCFLSKRLFASSNLFLVKPLDAHAAGWKIAS